MRTRALAVIAIFLAVLGAGCDARRDQSARIDVQWHKSNLADGLLPRWLAAAPGEAGAESRDLTRHKADPGVKIPHPAILQISATHGPHEHPP